MRLDYNYIFNLLAIKELTVMTVKKTRRPLAPCWRWLLPAGCSIDLVGSIRCSLALADWDKTVAKSCKSTTGSCFVFWVYFPFFLFLLYSGSTSDCLGEHSPEDMKMLPTQVDFFDCVCSDHSNSSFHSQTGTPTQSVPQWSR